jgi:hypothetical protein
MFAHQVTRRSHRQACGGAVWPRPSPRVEREVWAMGSVWATDEEVLPRPAATGSDLLLGNAAGR